MKMLLRHSEGKRDYWDQYGLMQFFFTLKNLLNVLIYTNLHLKSCHYLYKGLKNHLKWHNMGSWEEKLSLTCKSIVYFCLTLLIIGQNKTCDERKYLMQMFFIPSNYLKLSLLVLVLRSIYKLRKGNRCNWTIEGMNDMKPYL